jgi:large subunit ribosomal protein L24
MHVKKGDKVIVIAGKEKGKSSVVVSVDKEKNRVTLEGLNMVKKHTRPTKTGVKGGIIEVPASIHASNVRLTDKVTKVAKTVKTKKEVAETKVKEVKEKKVATKKVAKKAK